MTPTHSIRPVLAIPLTLLVFGGAAPAVAQDDDRRDRGPTLSVTGRAEVPAVPDVAVVHLGAVAQAQDAATAQAQVNQVVQKVLEAVKQAGVPGEKIQTSGLSLSPVYSDPRPPRVPDARPAEPRIVGYRASNTLTVRVEDLTKVGNVIDAATGAGANEVQGISFTLPDDTKPRAEALAKAAREAAAKAKVLADAMNVELVAVRHVQEAGVQAGPPQPFFRGGAEMARVAATPIQPGQVRVEASVVITYRITAPRADDER